MARIQLRQIAYGRSGDKGDTSNVTVIPFRAEDYGLLCQYLTADRVKDAFANLVKGTVTRYEFPAAKILNFVLEEALDGGVSRSLNLDVHGKSWSSLMLGIELEIPE